MKPNGSTLPRQAMKHLPAHATKRRTLLFTLASLSLSFALPVIIRKGVALHRLDSDKEFVVLDGWVLPTSYFRD